MKLLSKVDLEERGLKRSDVQRWRDVRAGKFPKPVKVGCRNLWVETEIDNWIAERIAERDGAVAA